MEREAKQALVDEMNEIFCNANAGVLVDYQGLEVNTLVELRKKLNESSSKFRVIKNTLARRAVKGTPFEAIEDQFVNTCALVFSYEDPVGQAKVLKDFSKEHEALKVKAGILSNQDKVTVLDTKQVSALASLPSKEELVVKLLYLMNAPATQFVRTLNEVPASFVRTLAAVAASKQE